jgi:hypothetical protein
VMRVRALRDPQNQDRKGVMAGDTKNTLAQGMCLYEGRRRQTDCDGVWKKATQGSMDCLERR